MPTPRCSIGTSSAVVGVGDAESAGCDLQLRDDVGDPLGAASFQHLSRGRAGDRQPVARRRRYMSGARRDDEFVAFAQHDQHRTRIDERAATLDDQLEDAVELRDACDRVGDVARRLERRDGPLGFLAAPLAGLIQARVLDRGRRPWRQDHRRLLVGSVNSPPPSFSVR